MWQQLSSFEPLGLKIIFFCCVTQGSWFQACLLWFTRTGLDNCLVHQGESNVSTILTDGHETTCHFPYGLKENVIFILGKLLANLPDCTVEGLVQPTFFTSATEDVVFAAFQYRISHANTKVFTVFSLPSQTYKPSAGMKFLFTTLTFIPHALQVRHW